MNGERKKKIEKSCRKIISDFLTQELPDGENVFGIINVGEIILSSDSSYLDIYVSTFNHPEILAKTLAKYAYLIQRNIGKQIGLQRNPKVRFRYDDSGQISTEISNAINSLPNETSSLEE